MDIHVLYHIVLYTILFIPITLFLKKGYLFYTLLISLPILGELVQIVLTKIFPNIPYFLFEFEYLDIGTNAIGSLIGIGIVRLIAFLK